MSAAPDPDDPVEAPPDPGIFPNAAAGESHIDLPAGKELSVAEVSDITRAYRTRVITVAGSPESGKTTLLTCLYELLQTEPLADYLFAGSSTLPGFEERCHLSRIASGREVAHTARTVPGFEPQFLHLRLRRADLREPARDLVLTDLSGENFVKAANSAKDCLALGGLRRSDHFVLLIDGEKLVLLEERHRVVQEAFSVLRGCLDYGVLTSQTFVDVLVSKWDQIVVAADQAAIRTFVTETWEETQRRFGGRVGRLRCSEVACRPTPGSKLCLGYGIKALVVGWIEESPFERRSELHPRPELAPGMREVDRFLFRPSVPVYPPI